MDETIDEVKSLGKSLQAIGDALVDYFDYRLLTGKFVGDIFHVIKRPIVFLLKKSKALAVVVSKGETAQSLRAALRTQWATLLKITFFKNSIELLTSAGTLFIKYFSEMFLIFALTFPSVILLLNFFESSTLLFFIGFLPILFFNVFCYSALYYFIEEQEKGEKLSLWQSFPHILPRLSIICFTTSIQLALILEFTIGLFIFALFYSYFFDAMNLTWSNSFFYWYVIIALGLAVTVSSFILNILSHQIYFSLLFEKDGFHQAIKKGWQVIKLYASYFAFHYLFLSLFCSILIYWATLRYLYLGTAISVFLFILSSLFLGFLLHRKFSTIVTLPTLQTGKNIISIFAIIIFLGFINYLLVASVISKQYQNITAAIHTQQKNFLLAQRLTTYTNNAYHYKVAYPQNWTIYDNQKNAVTFYNNYTGTVSGGVWLTITVSPYSEKEFMRFYTVRPGLVTFITETKDITTKISNFEKQGYPAVSFSYSKPSTLHPQYETHYLIHKDDKQYDLTFIAKALDIEDYNSDLFEKVVASFRFIK